MLRTPTLDRTSFLGCHASHGNPAKLQSMEKFQRGRRAGKDYSCLIDDMTGTEDYVDYLLSRITCLADLDDPE
jgi:hypothetical protein